MIDMDNFIFQLAVLRKRLIKCFIMLVIVVLGLMPFANVIFHYLAIPLLHQLTPGHLIATGIASPLLVPIKFTTFVSLFLVFPYFIFQLWSFVAPGLYENEKKILWVMMILSSLLFYLGMGFAYFIVFPLMFKFLMSCLPMGVIAMPDMSQYLEFCMKLFFAFGIAFQVPVVVIMLMVTGITDIETLKKIRPYVIVGAFILAMIIAPPDVLSQILLAVPMYLLYELGVVLGKYFVRVRV